jgi:dihydroxyacid dehydratase/phosphogluconate dehydratase
MVTVRGGARASRFTDHAEDAGTVQTLNAASRMGWFRFRKPRCRRRACARLVVAAVLGAAATSQVVSEASGFHCPFGARAVRITGMARHGGVLPVRFIIWKTQTHDTRNFKPASIQNAMVLHAAFGGSAVCFCTFRPLPTPPD